jgi:anionic cell wall polymer biosynthesis LytR-Cps2A-Psr (LCP) family protein
VSIPWRVLITIVGALVIVLGFGALSLVLGEGGDPTPSPSPTSTRPAERTLLLQILDEQGYALGNFVLGIEQEPDSTTLLAIPASLLVSVEDDTMALGMTPASPDTLAAVKGVESTVGIRIDAALTLDRLAFAGLIDAVDGVWVELPTAVVLPEISETDQTRILGPGWVKLDGLAAADYAVLRLPGEEEPARLARVQKVLQLALDGLPHNAERMRQLLTSLGSLAQSTVPTEELVPFLLQVRWDVNFGDARYAVLPVEVIRSGVRPASVLAPEAPAVVAELFPDALIESDVTG